MGSPSRDRSIVLVAGSGRSGTSLFSGLLQRLGYHVPQPEVPPDVSNPKGFAESQWVVDFHSRMLTSAKVQTADARPASWAATASVAAAERNVLALRGFLEAQLAEADHLVIKDPRLVWFLPLWRRCASELGVTPAVVTMLRHPAAVVDSKHRYYGSWHGDVGRAAGWLNTMLFTERATRDCSRSFVRYDDLLDDWPAAVARVGEQLDLSVIRGAGAPAMRRGHRFLDPSLSRSSTSWGDVRMPASLRQQAEHVWELFGRLAGADPVEEAVVAVALDEARTAYLDLYDEAEGIAQSSIWGARQVSGPTGPPTLQRLVRRVPQRYRRQVPVGLRRRFIRTVRRSRR